MLYEYWTRKLLPADHLAGAVCYCFIECDTCKSMSGKAGVLQTWHLAFTKDFNRLIRPENFVSPALRVLQVTVGRLQVGSRAFYKGVAPVWPYRPDQWMTVELVVPSGRSPLSTEELWCSDRVATRFMVTSLTKALLLWSLGFFSGRCRKLEFTPTMPP